MKKSDFSASGTVAISGFRRLSEIRGHIDAEYDMFCTEWHRNCFSIRCKN